MPRLGHDRSRVVFIRCSRQDEFVRASPDLNEVDQAPTGPMAVTREDIELRRAREASSSWYGVEPDIQC